MSVKLSGITPDKNVIENMKNVNHITTKNFPLQTSNLFLICKLYCCVMGNITASMINGEKPSLWQSNESSLLKIFPKCSFLHRF